MEDVDMSDCLSEDGSDFSDVFSQALTGNELSSQLLNGSQSFSQSLNQSFAQSQDQTSSQVINESNWSKNYKVDDVQDFSGLSGPIEELKNCNNLTPFKLFMLFFSEEVLNFIVYQTNLYASQKYEQLNKLNTTNSEQTFQTFQPINLNEMKTFLGINLFMGINKRASVKDYWSTESDLRCDYVTRLMSLRRFTFLLANIHFNDNSKMPKKGQPNFDKLYKIRPLINSLSDSFLRFYNPKENLAVDEAMIKFKGRSAMKQYMRDKPVKRGFKVWMLNDATFYNLKFEIYTGKIDDKIEKGLAKRVVSDLTKGFEFKNHKLYMDNFFSSLSLFEELKSKQIFACGTVRPNSKGLPLLKQDKSLKSSEFDYQVNKNGIFYCKWIDKRPVSFLSAFYNSYQIESVKRKQKDGKSKQVSCPSVVKDYNMHMNFVDNFDRLKNDYQIDRKSQRWYMRIFYFLLECSITNAFIVHQQIEMIHYTNKNFRRQIYKELLEQDADGNQIEVLFSQNKRMRIEVVEKSDGHHPISSTKRRCALCAKNDTQSRTYWICSICQVPLCLSKSRIFFREFHTSDE